MNIIDTRAENILGFLRTESIKNIPLFKLEPIDYELEDNNFSEIIFQSSPAVDFFKDHSLLTDKQIYSMGQATSATLESKGLSSFISANSNTCTARNLRDTPASRIL